MPGSVRFDINRDSKILWLLVCLSVRGGMEGSSDLQKVNVNI